MKFSSLVGLTITGVLAAVLVGWFGFYNVSAKDKHWEITNKVMEFVRERSIEVRTDDIVVPKNLTDKKMITKGAKNYDAMCAQCHLSPVKQPTELSQGLYPEPPVFHENIHASHDPKSMFWIIKNGIKLTGMPAWGDFHTEQQMWQMVAFLNS